MSPTVHPVEKHEAQLERHEKQEIKGGIMKIKLVFDDGSETEISERGLKELAKALNGEIQEKKVMLNPWGRYPYSTTNGEPVLASPPSQCECIKTDYFINSPTHGTTMRKLLAT